MGQQQQQQGQQPDNSFAVIWLMILAMIVVYFIWYQYHAVIVAYIFRVKLFEAKFLALFTSALNPVIKEMETADPMSITFDQLDLVSTYVGDFVRYPIIAILSMLAYVLYISNPVTRFRKTYTMKKLAEQEYENWAPICPVIKLDLQNTDITKGPWAMASSPLDFAKQHKLLKRNLRARAQMTPGGDQSQISVIRPEAKKIFSMQLGDYWQGPNSLKPHTFALFAAFAAKINRDRSGCEKLLEQINRSTLSGRLNFSGARELLRKHYDTKVVIDVMQQHAYTLTVMASMLEQSRNDGVFAVAEFLWLKAVDRPLWYMLSSVGRQTAFPEVSGVFAHWLSEKAFKHRIMVPVVDEAVNGLEEAMQAIKLKAEELKELEQ